MLFYFLLAQFVGAVMCVLMFIFVIGSNNFFFVLAYGNEYL